MYQISKTKRHKWDDEEVHNLIVLTKTYGRKWKFIAKKLTHRTARQCYQKFEMISKSDLQGQWSDIEDRKLIKWVNANGPFKWNLCRDSIPGRTGKQCRYRWLNYLDPGVKKGKWTDSEFLQLFTLLESGNRSWVVISKQMNQRSQISIKNLVYSSCLKMHKSVLGEVIMILFSIENKSGATYYKNRTISNDISGIKNLVRHCIFKMNKFCLLIVKHIFSFKGKDDALTLYLIDLIFPLNNQSKRKWIQPNMYLEQKWKDILDVILVLLGLENNFFNKSNKNLNYSRNYLNKEIKTKNNTAKPKITIPKLIKTNKNQNKITLKIEKKDGNLNFKKLRQSLIKDKVQEDFKTKIKSKKICKHRLKLNLMKSRLKVLNRYKLIKKIFEQKLLAEESGMKKFSQLLVKLNYIDRRQSNFLNI